MEEKSAIVCMYMEGKGHKKYSIVGFPVSGDN